MDPVTRQGGASWRDLVPPRRDDSAPLPQLALGVELRVTTRRSEWEPRREQRATPRLLAAGSVPRLGLRPLLRSDATGAWIKGGVSWDALRHHGHRYHQGSVRWLLELYSIARDTRALGAFPDAAEWVAMDDISSHLLWPHLAGAASAGILLVAASPTQSVTLAGSAEADVCVARGDGGGLRLSVELRIDGDTVRTGGARPIAHTGVYAWQVREGDLALTLAPVRLDHASATLLAHPDGLPVPAGDEREFIDVALPRLRRQGHVVPAAGLSLPAPSPPRLEVRVRHRRGDVVEVATGWLYPSGRRAVFAPAEDPDRDADVEASLAAAMRDAWATATDLPFAAETAFHGADAARFSAELLPALAALDGVDVIESGPHRDYRRLDGGPHISFEVVPSEKTDWFDLGVIVTVDGRRIPFRPLFIALSRRQGTMLLADGGYFSLRHPALDRLRALVDEATEIVEWETGPRLSRYQITLFEDFEDLADQAPAAVQWRAAARGLLEADLSASEPTPDGLKAALRPYQHDGLTWLMRLRRQAMGGILADDMGLGKTLQALGLFTAEREAGLADGRPSLVVAPTSVLETWRAEAAQHAPGLRVSVVTTTREARRQPETSPPPDVIVTSFAVLRLAADALTARDWSSVVIDEAQFVKNPATKIHRAARSLRADAVFALTGTPMENSLQDVWAVCALTSPGLFPSLPRFRRDYITPLDRGMSQPGAASAPDRGERVARLRRRLRPFLLRRTKDLVTPDLPARQEQVLTVELSPAHRALYDATLQRERQKVLGVLDEGDMDRSRFIVFRSLTLLRRLASAPALIDGRHQRLGSAKLDALVENLSEVRDGGHRALVFSPFTSLLQLASRRLDAAGLHHEYLDGATSRRADVIDAFRHGDATAFLISLKAGGFGLTLTEADYVFLLDPWWNPAAEAQAVDRAHRIGQRRSVFVYRMIARDTIEEKVLALQARKSRLARAVLDDGDLFARSLTADDIRGLFAK